MFSTQIPCSVGTEIEPKRDKLGVGANGDEPVLGRVSKQVTSFVNLAITRCTRSNARNHDTYRYQLGGTYAL